MRRRLRFLLPAVGALAGWAGLASGEEAPAPAPAPRTGLERLADAAPSGGQALPAGALARMGGSAWRVPANLQSAQLCRDGSRLVLAAGDAFTVLDARDGTVVGRLRWQAEEAPADWAVSPDGKTLAVLGAGALHLRAVDAEAAGRALPTAASVPKAQALALSPDGRRWAAAGAGRLAVWGAEGTTPLAVADDPAGAAPVTSAAFLADGETLAVAHADGSLTFWAPARKAPPARAQVVDVPGPAGGAFLRVLATPQPGRAAVEFEHTVREDDPLPMMPDTDTVRGVVVWEVEPGRELARKEIHLARHRVLSFAADGGSVVHVEAAGLSDDVQQVSIFDLSLTEPRHRVRVKSPTPWGLLHPDGRTYTLLTEAGALRVDAQERKITGRPDGHSAPVTALAFVPTGDRLVSGDESGAGIVWSARSGAALQRLPAPPFGPLTTLGADAAGARLAYCAGLKIHTVDATSGAGLGSVDLRLSVDAGRMSPDLARLVVGRLDTLALVEVATGRLLREAQAPGGSVASLAVTADFRTVVFGRTNGTLGLWDLGQEGPPRVLASVPGHDDEIQAVAVSADGATLVAFSYGSHKIHVLDVKTGAFRREIDPQEWWLGAQGLLLSPDGRRLVVGGDRIQAFDVETGALLGALEPPSHAALLAVDAGFTTLASGHKDGAVYVWRLPPAPPR